MGAMTAGEAGAMAPDFGEAKLAANRIIKLLNTKVVHKDKTFNLTLFRVKSQPMNPPRMRGNSHQPVALCQRDAKVVSVSKMSSLSTRHDQT